MSLTWPLTALFGLWSCISKDKELEGKNLLFSKQNLFYLNILLFILFYYYADDLSSRDGTCSDILKTEFRLLPHTANMNTATNEKV